MLVKSVDHNRILALQITLNKILFIFSDLFFSLPPLIYAFLPPSYFL